MTYQFFATTAKYLEPLLSEELRQLQLPEVKETRAGTYFRGEIEHAYRACLWSRIANSVLLVLAKFQADSPEALYAGIRDINWNEHFDVDQTFAVNVNVSHSKITHSHYAALKVKDAIVDQFRELTSNRPSVTTDQPDISINVYIRKDEATVSLDISGDSLHKRAYRENGAAAPLKENLAAAILQRAEWPAIAADGGSLLDPMCGSGTLLIEGAMMAGDIAPGLLREHWGFLRWKQHQPQLWEQLLIEAQQRKQQGLQKLGSIRGYDQNFRTVNIAAENIRRAGLNGYVHVEKCDVVDAAPGSSKDQPGLVIVNPPYGERLGERAQLHTLYRQLGETLKARFVHWKAGVFTNTDELIKPMGLRYARSHNFYNGALECKLFRFDVDEDNFTSGQARPRPLPADERSEAAQMFANRIGKNLKKFARWLKRDDIHCYRLYDADLPEYSVAVDVYEGNKRWVHVQEYEAPKTIDQQKARHRLREVLGVLIDELGITNDQLFFKVRRKQKGLAQYERLAENRVYHEVSEGGCRFWVNFEDYLDTGLFLDHRITRSIIRDEAKDKRFLNLFAYTGSGTVYAAAGGAKSTVTVDMSRTYLEWAQRNMELNNFSGKQHQFEQANCLEWMDKAVRRKQEFDLIFLDPPSFSSSKRMESTFDVQRDQVALVEQACALLSSDGVLLFSNNLRSFKLDPKLAEKYVIKDLSRATLPEDFARNPKIHHCWKISKK